MNNETLKRKFKAARKEYKDDPSIFGSIEIAYLAMKMDDRGLLKPKHNIGLIFDNVIRELSAEGIPTAGTDDSLHCVVDGETLQSIARDALGDFTRWSEIFQLNRRMLVSTARYYHQPSDGDYIKPGMVLILPRK